MTESASAPAETALTACPDQLGPRHVPATASQEGLWLLHHSVEERYVYNCPLAFRVLGMLDEQGLIGAFTDLVRRHECLRTVFASEEGRLLQIVREECTFTFERFDLSTLAPAEGQAELERLTLASGMDVFDLERGPLLRVALLRVTPEEHALLITLHHTVYDEWSTDILIEEIGLLYDRRVRAANPDELPPPAMQFAEFALRQRAAEQSKARQRQLGYWRRKLAGAARPVTPPLDRRATAALTDFRGAQQRFTLEAPVRTALEGLAQKEYSPPVAILIAALAVVLQRYSRESDISVGYLVSGRVLPQTEKMIGLFVNSLVMRVQVEPDLSFVELVRKVRDLTFEAYSNQDVPFQQVVRELNPTREAFGHPLFRTCVNYHPGARRVLQLDSLTTEVLPCVQIAPFDFLLDAHPAADGCIHCHFEYRSALFDAAAVGRFAEHFRTLLAGCLRSPTQPLAQISMLEAAERTQLLHGYHSTRDYDLQRPLTEILKAQARATPQQPALVFAGQTLTYAQFDRRTDDVAAFLQQRGVGPEMLVGLFAEACSDLLIGMFGILKAGAAYVAIDPQDPPARIAFMLEDARVALVLTQERCAERLPGNSPPHACLDRDAALFAAAGEPRAVQHDARQLAYLMYTSGSTGKPKAVAVAWSSVLNHVHSFCEASGLRASDRCMLFSSVAFDGSVEEIFAPLLSGATLVIHPERPMPIETLENLVVQHALTFLDFTAGYWNVWLETLLARRRQIPPPVRQVIIGGEMIRANQLLGWEQVNRSGEVDLLITYGPTEATVIATAVPYRSARNPQGPEPRDGYMGRALGNLAVHVLDEELQPVPVGAVGDVYIAGPNLARGYLAAPVQTAERFIPNPHAQRRGERMYKTGDLALRRADGTLQYLGRADNQVKFRGFRIELGEIDRTLALFPHAQAGVTLIAKAPNGDPTLVAFVMPTSGNELDATAISQFVASRLPAYMVPQRIEIVRTFPVKPSGKTDLVKLGESITWASETPAPAVAAATTTAPNADGLTAEITQLFSTLLNRGPLQADDNFFKSGGHSLLALQVLSRIRQLHGTQIPMKDFYLNPTPKGIAELMARLKQDASAPAKPKLAPLTRIQRNPVPGAAS